MNIRVILLLVGVFFIAVPAQAEISASTTNSASRDQALETFQQLTQSAKFTAAIEHGRTAFASRLDSLGKDDTALVPLGLSLARELRNRGAHQEAYGIVQECLGRLVRTFGSESGEVVPALAELAKMQSAQMSLATFTRALSLQKQHYPDQMLAYGTLAMSAGKHLANQRSNRKEAVSLLRQALDVYKAEYGDKAVEIVEPLMLLGGSTVEWNHYREARRYFDRAIGIAKKSGDRQLYASTLGEAGTYLLNSYSSDTGKYLLKATKEFTSLLGPDHVETANAQVRLSEYYLKEGKVKKAEPGLLAALDVFKDNPDYRDYTLSALSMLVETYELRGDSDKATDYCRTIGEIQPWTSNQQANPIYRRKVKYPSTAAKNGYRGYVVTEFEVDENGFVRSPVVVDSRGPGSFEREALRAIAGFRYAPRFENGVPVSTANVRYRVNFKLDKRQSGTR